MISRITGPLCRSLLLAAALLITLSGGILLHVYTLPVLALLCFVAWPRVRAWPGWSHGTARISNVHDLMRRKLLGSDGLVIGRATFVNPPTRWQALRCLLSPFVGSALAVRMMLAAFWRGYDNSIIRLHGGVHAITFAPTGAGKGTCVQIPNLFTYRGSMVVVDPQGTLFKVTAWFREKVLGHKIIKMDPLGFTGPAAESDCLNPCRLIDEKSPMFIDDVYSLVGLLVKREANEFQPHFNDWAIICLCSVLCFVCACEADETKRTLEGMRDLVCSKKVVTDAVGAMRQVPGIVAKMGDMLSIPLDKEFSAILSTIQRHTFWIDSPLIAANLSKSTWDPRKLRSERTTVYLILPSNKLSDLSPLMRLWLGVILHAVTQQGTNEKYPVMFMIDEAAHIGKIQTLEDAITLYRAYGVRIWLFMQSVQQVQKIFGDNAQTILDNMSIQQFFGTVAVESGDYISRRVGDCTMLVESINRNHSRSRPTGIGHDQQGSLSTGDGTTISEAGRRLLRPEEILVLPENVSLTFFKNMYVIISELVPYYADPAFRKGGGGRSQGVGLAAGVFSVVAVVLAFAVLLIVASLPDPATMRRAAFVPQPPPGGVTPYDSGLPPMPPYERGRLDSVPPLPYGGGYGPSPAYRAIPSRPVPRRGRIRPSPGIPPYHPAPVPGRDFYVR